MRTRPIAERRAGRPAQLGGYPGLAFHYVVGESIAPLLGLALLVCSFFTRTRSTPVWGAVVMVSIIAQVLLGLAAFHAAAAGAAHGLLAVVTFVITGTPVTGPPAPPAPRSARRIRKEA